MKTLLTFLILPLALATPSPAQDAAAEAKLREALRTTALQLRTAQADVANAQASTAAAEQKAKDLEKQLAAANGKLTTQTQRASEDRTTSEQTIASLNNKLADREKRIGEFTEALAKWKVSYQQMAILAETRDQEKTTLAAEAAGLKLTVADRERKNLALFNTASGILDRYEKHALGKAILAKEPFTQTTRVKIESLVQGYQDRILDNRISARP